MITNYPLSEIRKRKRRAYLIALISGLIAALLVWYSRASNDALSRGDLLIIPLAFIGLIILIFLTLKGDRLDIVEIGLFGLTSIALLASFAESMLSNPIDMVDLADILYWFAFVYLLGFMVLKPPADWIVLSIFLFLTLITGLMHFAIHDSSIGNGAEVTFLLRFFMAQVSLFAVSFSLFRLNENIIQLRIAGDAWEKLALTDSLTQINNRMALSDELDRELAQVQRHRRESSIVMVDVDNFKMINDEHGHSVGDKVLQKVAQAIQGVLREGDFLARFGGDEFVVILPETDEEAAEKVGKRIHSSIAGIQVKDINEIKISFGVSELNASNSKQEVFNIVDQRLYRAKRRS